MPRCGEQPKCRQRTDARRPSARLAAGYLAALLLCVVTGCGVPEPESQYVPMADGTRLAVDVWRPGNGAEGETYPAVLRLGRYWRDYQLPNMFPPFVGKYLSSGAWLNEAGYAVVMVDVRGTGASFGVSTAPWSPAEVGDFPQLVDWITAQPWSNGIVGGVGVSYEGVTADWLAASDHPAVAAVLPAYSYCDVFLDVSHPGGVFNERFVRAWGDVTSRMDRNDLTFLDVVMVANPRGWLAIFGDLVAAALLGVRPISGAANLLADAIAQHQDNPSVFEACRSIEYRDDPFLGLTTDTVSPLRGAASVTRRAAIERVVGWQDAGTARGALSSFNTLAADYHVVILAPHAHTGDWYVDPYYFGEPIPLALASVISEIWRAVPFLDGQMRADRGAARHEVVYWTYVADEWQTATGWPPDGFQRQRWYCGPGGTLQREPPTAASGADVYTVDFEATTGLENRWFSGMSGAPVRYVDRAEQDRRLLVYQTPPFPQAMELTGHPVVSLQVVSTHADGAFYAYLEDVAPDGRVVYLTEGELRAVHRRISTDPPPVAVFGPHHTFRRGDALPLVPGEAAEITFDLHPISTVIRAGHRLRLALAGHDRDTFTRYPADGTPTWRVQRNAGAASWIEVPLKPRAGFP